MIGRRDALASSLGIDTTVYKTKDVLFNKSINLGNRIKEYKKLPISASISIKLGEEILLKLNYKNHAVYQKSVYIVTESLKNETTKEDVIAHLSKLNDTPYYLKDIDINIDKGIFVPVSVINDLRREAINKLNNSRLNLKVIKSKNN